MRDEQEKEKSKKKKRVSRQDKKKNKYLKKKKTMIRYKTRIPISKKNAKIAPQCYFYVTQTCCHNSTKSKGAVVSALELTQRNKSARFANTATFSNEITGEVAPVLPSWAI